MRVSPDEDPNALEYVAGEQQVFFAGDYCLEGKFGWPGVPFYGAQSMPAWEVKGGVVIAHPYPPGGANMDLPVIHRIAKYCRERGFASLRFNFRSVGESHGEFSGTEEYRDVAAALSYMMGRLDPDELLDWYRMPLALAGWSFGSAMAAWAAAEVGEVKALALVGFPLHWEELPEGTLDRLAGFNGALLVVCAENDHHGSPHEVQQALLGVGLKPQIEVVAGADHYLRGHERAVGKSVAGFFAEVLGH